MIELVHGADSTPAPAAPHLCVRLAEEADTLAFGALLATVLPQTMVIYLVGDLGAGKTTLVRGLLQSMGYNGKVKSPTYTLVEPYAVSRLNLYHFDFYRFNHPDEYLEAGLDEYFAANAICLVEWPSKAAPHLAAPDLEIRLDLVAPGRLLTATASTETGRQCILRILAQLPTPPSSPTQD